MSIRTGICRHCGKKEEDHYGSEWYEDSGLFALDAHKEELYEAVSWIPDHAFPMDDGKPLKGFMVVFSEDEFNKLESILNQIEKEKSTNNQ